MRAILLALSLCFIAVIFRGQPWNALPFLALPPLWYLLQRWARAKTRDSLFWFWLVAGFLLLPLLLLKPSLSLSLGLAMPAGLSFLVFQAIAFHADWRKRRIPEFPRFADYALYLLFFPKLLAGPLDRFPRFLSELAQARLFPKDKRAAALELIATGLAKKFLLANYLAVHTSAWFDRPGPPASLLEAISVTCSFAVEFYCDFSAYTDIALGIALLFGISLPQNFSQPYLAENPQDFWQRWHMSLSAWFRDYVHFPIFFATKNIYITVFATFFLMGLWHGVGANYLALGAFWGAVMAAYSWIQPSRVLYKARFSGRAWFSSVNRGATALLVLCSFFLLRAEAPFAWERLSLHLSWSRLTPLFSWSLSPFVEQSLLRLAFSLPLLFCVEMVRHRKGGFFQLTLSKKIGFVALLAYYAFILFYFTEEKGLSDVRFLYFQF